VAMFILEQAYSLEAPALYALRARLSECVCFQELAGQPYGGGDAAAALLKITICSETEPWDAQSKISRAQLEDMLLQADIGPARNQSLNVSTKVGDPEGRCPNQTGMLAVMIRRQITATEMANYGPDDMYLWFLDRIAGLQGQLHLRADAIGAPLISEVDRDAPPLWQTGLSETAQGFMLWCELLVRWGDRGGRGE
jgi:hypothetical protein